MFRPFTLYLVAALSPIPVNAKYRCVSKVYTFICPLLCSLWFTLSWQCPSIQIPEVQRSTRQVQRSTRQVHPRPSSSTSSSYKYSSSSAFKPFQVQRGIFTGNWTIQIYSVICPRSKIDGQFKLSVSFFILILSVYIERGKFFNLPVKLCKVMLNG